MNRTVGAPSTMWSDPMKCNVLIIHYDGQYQATCKPCRNWESPPFDVKWMAERAGHEHSGVVEEHPPRQRGPG